MTFNPYYTSRSAPKGIRYSINVHTYGKITLMGGRKGVIRFEKEGSKKKSHISRGDNTCNTVHHTLGRGNCVMLDVGHSTRIMGLIGHRKSKCVFSSTSETNVSIQKLCSLKKTTISV